MPSRQPWMATRKAVTRKSLQSPCRDHTVIGGFMETFFSTSQARPGGVKPFILFWSDINFHVELIPEFKFDGKTVCGWSKTLQGGPSHHLATKLTGSPLRSEPGKIGSNEVWFTHRAWSLKAPNDPLQSPLSHATLQSSSSSGGGGGLH